MYKRLLQLILIILFAIEAECLWAQDHSFGQWVEQGDLYIQIGQYRQAIDCFNKALELKDTLSVKKRLVYAFELTGLYHKAINLQQKIVDHDTLNETQLFKLANLYKKVDANRQAYKLLQTLNKLNDTNPTYIYEMALLTDDLKAQKYLLLKCYQADSLHLKSIVKLALLYQRLDQQDSTQYFVDKGLKITSNHIKLKYVKAKWLYQQEHYQQAYDLFFDLLKSDNDNIKTNLYLGIICIQLDQLDKAEYYLDRAYRLNPNMADTNYYLGLLYQALKDYEKSNAYLLQSIALKQPDVTRDYYRLGLNAQMQKQPQQALVFFKKSYDNNPDYYLALYEIAVMTDLLYEDKQMALHYYTIYLKKFTAKDNSYTDYVQKRLNQINQKTFMNGKN